MSAMTDYLENKLIDQIFRGQASVAPASLYVALFTAAPSDAAGGTECSGNAYARVAVTSSLANWAGTQAAGSTVASSGTGGQTSNNGAITFPTPTGGGRGTVTHFAIFDASTGGNMLLEGALTIAKTINEADTVSFPAGSLAITFA
jgi:hypothetical protein